MLSRASRGENTVLGITRRLSTGPAPSGDVPSAHRILPGRRDSLACMESWGAVSLPDLPGRGPEPRLMDTASGELSLAAVGSRAARIYACGITPYDATHIGHAATYTAWDLLIRAWLDAAPENPETPETPETPGRPARYTVAYVQNVTDVDDPLLERAERD